MSAVRYETDGSLAVITMTHEPYNLLGPDLMPRLIAGMQKALSDSPHGTVTSSA
jgi:hypothetical protein